MIEKLEVLKKIVCLFLCLIIAIQVLPIHNIVDAREEYEYVSTSGNEEIQDLFDLKIVGKDALNSMPAVINWISQKNTYIVGKVDSSGNVVKTYMNVPNVQMWINNQFKKQFTDGWETTMFIPQDDFIDRIGTSDADILTKYGFNLPLPEYKGEYPVITYSLTDMLIPDGNIFQKIGKGAIKLIKSLFGYSIIDAPDYHNYATLQYNNHTYYNSEQEKLIVFLSNNWNKIKDSFWLGNDSKIYFSSPKEVAKGMTITEDRAVQALAFVNSKIEEVADIKYRQALSEWWDTYCNSGWSVYLGTSHKPEKIDPPGEISKGSSIPGNPGWQEGEEEEVINQRFKDAYDEYKNWVPVLPEGWYSRVEFVPIGTVIIKPGAKAEEGNGVDITIYFQYDEDHNEINHTTNFPGKARPTNPTDNWIRNYRSVEHPSNKYEAPSAEELALLETYDKNVDDYNTWLSFITKMNNGSDYRETAGWHLFSGTNTKPATYNYYSQCLLQITKDDEKEQKEDNTEYKCSKKINGQRVIGDMAHFFVNTGVYKLNVAENNTRQARQDALKIISLLQNKLGSAYSEMMEIFLEVQYSINDARGGDYLNLDGLDFEDPRVMPYDKDTLATDSDRNLDLVDDPRVVIYKETFMGDALANSNIDFIKLFPKNAMSKFLINLGSTVSRITILIIEYTSFTWLEDVGLSPASMWTYFPVTLFTIFLMILLVIQIVLSALKYLKGSGGIGDLLTRLFVFLIAVGLVCMLTTNPNGTWNFIKRVNNKAIALAETENLKAKDGVAELYGDEVNSAATSYYIPYFNMWTKYMTGYKLNDSSQFLTSSKSLPEETDIKVPQINGKDVTLWPVILLDSFNYKGENFYIVDSTNEITYSGSSAINVNGYSVNRNAYRTIDHFLAPRVESSVSGSGKNKALNVKSTTNENYNGQFQNVDIMTLIGMDLGIINLCIVAAFKFLIFLWFWYLLYIFVFSIILDAAENRGNVKGIVLKTFSPLIGLIGFGLYASLLMNLIMHAEGFSSILINAFCIVISFKLIHIWHDMSMSTFPKTLSFIYAITKPAATRNNISRMIIRQNDEYIQNKYRDTDIINEDGSLNFELMFDINGQRPDRYKGNHFDEAYKHAALLFNNTYNDPRYGDEVSKMNAISSQYGYGALEYCKRMGYIRYNASQESDKDLNEKDLRFGKDFKNTLEEYWNNDTNEFYESHDVAQENSFVDAGEEHTYE